MEGWYTQSVERAITWVQSLPRRGSQSLRTVSPLASRFLQDLQVDSPLVILYAGMCLFVQLFAGDHYRTTLFAVGTSLEISPAGIFSLFGHVFGHADFAHLHGNVMLLLLVGPPCEAAFGAVRLSKVMCWVALASSLSHAVLGRAGSMQLGASGVVFAMILLNSLLQQRGGKVALTFVLTAVGWLHREVSEAVVGQSNVAHSAHLVGAAVGAWFGHRMHVQERRWGGVSWTYRKFD